MVADTPELPLTEAPYPADSRRCHAPALALVAVGILLRLPGLFTDFWLDEIWSWLLVHGEPLQHAWQLFAIRDINNHHLNSLVLYLLGPE